MASLIDTPYVLVSGSPRHFRISNCHYTSNLSSPSPISRLDMRTRTVPKEKNARVAYFLSYGLFLDLVARFVPYAAVLAFICIPFTVLKPGR